MASFVDKAVADETVAAETVAETVADETVAAETVAEPVDYNVVFSYQGAFGPPTYGHYKSMDAFAKQLTSDFAGQKILMLFMPTAGGSKAHLLPTRGTRKNVLDKFCQMLKVENPNITFETSEIENEIFDAAATKNKTTTIYTIQKLKELHPNSKICLGMGLDNAYQLPYWQDIDTYSGLVHKIYVVPRTPSAVELEKTRRFNVTNTDGSVVEMRFDITVPWTNNTFLKCFLPADSSVTVGKSEKENLIAALTSVNSDGSEPYVFYQSLPQVEVLTAQASASASALSIPATSSSMMRYFIGQFIQSINEESNRNKVQKLMFGPTITEEQNPLVETTIDDYRNNVFKGVFPPDDTNERYDIQYSNITEIAGGNRKTRRRRSQRKKRRSQRKKRRSQRK
jgi:nicotinic acid mononucleotide adenylyltransferase